MRGSRKCFVLCLCCIQCFPSHRSLKLLGLKMVQSVDPSLVQSYTRLCFWFILKPGPVSGLVSNHLLYLLQSVYRNVVPPKTRICVWFIPKPGPISQMFIRSIWIRKWVADWTNLDPKLLLPLVDICDSLLDQGGGGEDPDGARPCQFSTDLERRRILGHFETELMLARPREIQ